MCRRRIWLMIGFSVVIVGLCSLYFLNSVYAKDFATSLEIAIGQLAASDIEKQFGISENPEWNAVVQNIALRLAPLAPREGINYQFKVLNSDEVNACAVMGGYVYVNKGLLKALGFASNEFDPLALLRQIFGGGGMPLDPISPAHDELAFIIAHEISHIQYKHGVNQALMGLGLSVLLGGKDDQSKSKAAAQLVAQILLSGRSRSDEKEADLKGIELMQKAGYDPFKALAVMRRIETLSSKEKELGIEGMLKRLTATHPPTSDRCEYLKDYAIKAATGFTFKADIAQAASASSAGQCPISDGFDFPLGNPDNYSPWVITNGLGESWQDRSGKWYRGHLGEDYLLKNTKGENISEGKSVFACSKGLVIFAGDGGTGWGGVVIVKCQLPEGKIIYYQTAHLKHKELKVAVNQIVMRGQLLGYIAKLPQWPAHLHLEFKYQEAIDKEGNSSVGHGYSGKDGYAPYREVPSEFIRTHRTLILPEVGAPVQPRDKIEIEQGPVHLGDENADSVTIWIKEFLLNNSDLEGKTKAKIGLDVKGTPRKDPVICINRHKIGYAITHTGNWEKFEFPFDIKILQAGNNLIDIETVIANLWQTFDECEFSNVTLVLE